MATTTSNPPPPITSNASFSNDPSSSSNGVGGAVLSKRIKKLRKNIERSSAYVDIEVAKLNKDQVAALSKLEHQKHTLAELEELKKQIDVAELEQTGNVRAQKQDDDSNQQPSSSNTSIPTFVSFLRIYSILFPAASTFSIQSTTPASLKELTGQETASIGKTAHEIVSEGKVEVAEKLLKGGEEEVLEGVTYARLATIISNFASSSSPSPAEAAAPKPSTNGIVSDIASVIPTIKFGSTDAPAPPTTDEPTPSAPQTTASASSIITAPLASAASAISGMVFGSLSKEDASSVVPNSKETSPASEKKDEKTSTKQDEDVKKVEEKEEVSKAKIPEPSPVIDKGDEPVGPKGMEGEGEALDVAEEFDMGDPMEDREERAAVSDDEDDKVEESKKEESGPSASAAPLSSSIPSISIAASSKRTPAQPVNWADDDDDEYGGGLPPIPSFGERGKYITSSSPLNASSFGKSSPLAAASAPPVSKWGQTPFKSNLTKASVNAKPFSPAPKPTPLAGAPAPALTNSNPSAAASTSSRSGPNLFAPPTTSDTGGPAPTRESRQSQARDSLRENRPASSSAPVVDEDGFVTAGSGRNKKPHSGRGGGGDGGSWRTAGGDGGRGGRGGRGRGRGGRGGPRGGGGAPAAI